MGNKVVTNPDGPEKSLGQCGIEYLVSGCLVSVPEKVASEEDVTSGWQSKSENPVVSVICHCYNHEAFIESCLDGILNQITDFPFEIIVHDDASTDSTADILRQYQARFPGVIKPIYQNKNQYSQGARPLEFSLPVAKGEFIALCEADDYWISKDKLQVQVNRLRERPDLVMCFHNAIRINEEGEFLGMMNPCSSREISQANLSASPFIPTLTRMFRNHGYPWMSLQNTPIVNDICLTAYLSQFGGAEYLGNALLSVYRIHGGGVWSLYDKFRKARMTVDARLFIAGVMHDDAGPYSGYSVYQNLKISHAAILDLLRPMQAIKLTFFYFGKRFYNSIKKRLVLLLRAVRK